VAVFIISVIVVVIMIVIIIVSVVKHVLKIKMTQTPSGFPDLPASDVVTRPDFGCDVGRVRKDLFIFAVLQQRLNDTEPPDAPCEARVAKEGACEEPPLTGIWAVV